MEIHHGDLPDTERQSAAWSRWETDNESDHMLSSGRPFSDAIHFERNMKIKAMLSGWDNIEEVENKSLTPPPTPICSAFSQRYETSTEKSWPPVAHCNAAPTRQPIPVQTRAGLDPHGDICYHR